MWLLSHVCMDMFVCVCVLYAYVMKLSQDEALPVNNIR